MASAERTMLLEQISRDDRPMDEPTLDCYVCGAAATLTVVRHAIGEDGEWRQDGRVIICDEHQDRLMATVHGLQSWERVAVMKLC